VPESTHLFLYSVPIFATLISDLLIVCNVFLATELDTAED